MLETLNPTRLAAALIIDDLERAEQRAAQQFQSARQAGNRERAAEWQEVLQAVRALRSISRNA